MKWPVEDEERHDICTEVGVESPGQALALLSEDGPSFCMRGAIRDLSEKSWRPGLSTPTSVRDSLRFRPRIFSACLALESRCFNSSPASLQKIPKALIPTLIDVLGNCPDSVNKAGHI